MIEAICGEEDLQRRIEAQNRPRYWEKHPVRVQVRCRACRQKIPERKRADAVYCSRVCSANHRAAQRYKLQREVVLARRAILAVPRCPCGAALDSLHRRGPVPKQCARCYAHAWYLAHKAA